MKTLLCVAIAAGVAIGGGTAIDGLRPFLGDLGQMACGLGVPALILAIWFLIDRADAGKEARR